MTVDRVLHTLFKFEFQTPGHEKGQEEGHINQIPLHNYKFIFGPRKVNHHCQSTYSTSIKTM